MTRNAAPIPAPTALADRLHACCLERGWELQELARRAGISRTTLSHLLHGRTRQPHVATLHRLARALAIEPERLLARPPAMPEHAAPEPDRNAASRRLDRCTNGVVAEMADEEQTLFAGWTSEEWDELYSTFGTGRPLTREGVIAAAERMNRKRATVEQLQVLLETHLGDVAAGMIETLYRMVQPGEKGAPAEELRSPPGSAHALDAAPVPRGSLKG